MTRDSRATLGPAARTPAIPRKTKRAGTNGALQRPSSPPARSHRSIATGQGGSLASRTPGTWTCRAGAARFPRVLRRRVDRVGCTRRVGRSDGSTALAGWVDGSAEATHPGHRDPSMASFDVPIRQLRGCHSGRWASSLDPRPWVPWGSRVPQGRTAVPIESLSRGPRGYRSTPRDHLERCRRQDRVGSRPDRAHLKGGSAVPIEIMP